MRRNHQSEMAIRLDPISLKGESPMKSLLFGAAVAVIVISPALAGGGGNDMSTDQTCKGCPSWRSPASSDPPPVVGSGFPPDAVGRAFSACHLVKARIGTRHGHPVYQTRQAPAGERRPSRLDQRVIRAYLKHGRPRQEAFAIARQDACGNLPLSKTKPQHLGTGYVTQAEKDIALQLSKAGLRLALILNKSLRPN